MLLRRYQRKSSWSLCLIVLLLFGIARFAIANDDLNEKYEKLRIAIENSSQLKADQNNEEYIGNVFKALSENLEADDEKNHALLEQWNSYLIDISNFSNTDYLSAIEDQQIEYYKAITELNKGIDKIDSFQKKYSASWIDDLTKHFGKGFIKKNKNAILDNFSAIIARDYRLYENELKDLVYTEAMLYGSYKKYFGMFIDFYNEELDNNGRNKLKKHKDAVDVFLSIINDVSFTKMQERTVLTDKSAENKAIRLNEELFQFFKNHPISRAFDFSKAIDDLEKAIGTTKVKK